MNFFKSKKNKKPVPVKQPEPRLTEELTKIYQDLCRRAGEVQYVIAVNKAELNQINEALRGINNEAGARRELDAKAASSHSEPVAEASNG